MPGLIVPELVKNLRAFFLGRNEPNVAWGHLAGMYALPGLRGYWPLSSVDENGDVYDLSGQGRLLTNNSSLQFGVSGLAPYAIHDGSADYLSRADEAGLDITGALTVGCWVRVNALGVDYFVMGKAAIGVSNSFFLFRPLSPDGFYFAISNDGSLLYVTLSAASSVVGQWHYLVGRFTPSTEVALFMDGVKVTVTTSIPATIFNSAQPLTVGADGAGSNVLDGDTALPFLCSDALSDTIILNLWHSQKALFGR